MRGRTLLGLLLILFDGRSRVPALSRSLAGNAEVSADLVPGEAVGAGCAYGLIELGLDVLELFAQGADGVGVQVRGDEKVPLIDEQGLHSRTALSCSTRPDPSTAIFASRSRQNHAHNLNQ